LHGAFADNNETTDRHKWKTDKQQIRGGDKERGRKDNGAKDLASTKTIKCKVVISWSRHSQFHKPKSLKTIFTFQRSKDLIHTTAEACPYPVL